MPKTIQIFVDEFQSKTAIVKSVYLVRRFNAAHPFTLDEEVTFRPINIDDIKLYGRIETLALTTRPPWLNTEDWICEIVRTIPKESTQGLNSLDGVIDDTCNALNLVVEGTTEFTICESITIVIFFLRFQLCEELASHCHHTQESS